MEAVLGLCEQGGAVLPPHKTFHALSAAAAAQEPAANIWIAPFSMPWSHCSQHLRVPVLHVQTSLFFFHHLHLPLHSTNWFCHSQHLGFPVWIQAGWGAEGIYSILPGGSHTSLFQFLSQTQWPGQRLPRRGRKSRSKSWLQTSGWLSGVILGKEDDRSETRAAAREFLRMISPFNKCQHTPK